MDDKVIRDNFVKAVEIIAKEKKLHEYQVVESIGMNRVYFSQLKVKDNPEIKGSYLANLCLQHKFSIKWLLLDIPPMRMDSDERKILDRLKRIEDILEDVYSRHKKG